MISMPEDRRPSTLAVMAVAVQSCREDHEGIIGRSSGGVGTEGVGARGLRPNI